EAGDGLLEVAADGDTAAVGRRMTAFVCGVAPLQAGAGQIEETKRGTVVGEGEECSTDIVQEAGPRQRQRVNGAAGPRLRFDDEHLPAVPCQRRGGGEAV